MTDKHGDDLRAIPLDDPIRGDAGKVVEPPVDPQLELLPTKLRDSEDFERLLLDLGRDQLGLRSLSFFGNGANSR